MNPYAAPEELLCAAPRQSEPRFTTWGTRLFCCLASISGCIMLWPLLLVGIFLFFLPWIGWVAIAFGSSRFDTKLFWWVSSTTSLIGTAQASLFIHYEPHSTWHDPSLLFFWFQIVGVAAGSVFCLYRKYNGKFFEPGDYE